MNSQQLGTLACRALAVILAPGAIYMAANYPQLQALRSSSPELWERIGGTLPIVGLILHVALVLGLFIFAPTLANLFVPPSVPAASSAGLDVQAYWSIGAGVIGIYLLAMYGPQFIGQVLEAQQEAMGLTVWVWVDAARAGLGALLLLYGALSGPRPGKPSP